MKKVLFLGYVVTPKEANIASGASVAGNKMQWNILKNISSEENMEITCVTITPKASFPRDRCVYEKRRSEQLFPGVISHRVGYCNIPIIKQLWQIMSVYCTAKKWMKEKRIDTLFCFNLFPQIGIPMRWLKKENSGIDTICLLADLPFDDNTNRHGFSAFLRRRVENSTWKSMQNCDRYIVLNQSVIQKHLPSKPYIVVDGGISEEDIQRYSNTGARSKEKNILFCGALTAYNGILNLLDAMEMLKETDIVLDVYGGGYLEEQVKKAAGKNEKIRYHGSVSNDIVMQKQQEAWLLINPRIVNDPIAQVTFPSKTFEFLLSGTPVLSTKLNGYGAEYDGKMFYSEDDTPSGIADAILRIDRMTESEMQKTSAAGKQFVISEKNWSRQALKIAGFIRSVSS